MYLTDRLNGCSIRPSRQLNHAFFWFMPIVRPDYQVQMICMWMIFFSHRLVRYAKL
ncbi:uncharacterized protein EURHEDRAFT_192039 [Aspergillus ruber CBS 135680]|uniref:Uncharacterized protein n=1 Tax=Aspergillus ruber (strain CBS 135680) TaxID=1388766 RepID=A0A017S5Y4_ASPRC|nr:uncharacterized protein EURHEDRAFT_192039 [Aspergillus ruber CBS 135680]EYE92382.1 hypothetical protein EURHEDRAFT_192039 [Aspergillus ruber CBS 135680]